MTDWDDAFAGRLDAGSSPALLMVDPVSAYLEEQSPLYLESGRAAIAEMQNLLTMFRQLDLPIVWTGVRYLPDGSDGGYFYKKVPALALFAGDGPLGAFPADLVPLEGEAVFIKQYPSAFFGTDLDLWLNKRGVDTLFIGGFSTSGCVRASALDALQHGYIPMVVSNACADRDAEIHSQNLRDLGAKYAEIISVSDVSGILGGGWLTPD